MSKSLHTLSLVWLLLLVWANAPLQAQQATGPYIDSWLRLIRQPEVRQAIERTERLGGDQPAQGQPFAGRLALRRASALAAPRISVFAQLRDLRGLDELRALGAVIGSARNNVVTAELPVSALDRWNSSARFG